MGFRRSNKNGGRGKSSFPHLTNHSNQIHLRINPMKTKKLQKKPRNGWISYHSREITIILKLQNITHPPADFCSSPSLHNPRKRPPQMELWRSTTSWSLQQVAKGITILLRLRRSYRRNLMYDWWWSVWKKQMSGNFACGVGSNEEWNPNECFITSLKLTFFFSSDCMGSVSERKFFIPRSAPFDLECKHRLWFLVFVPESKGMMQLRSGGVKILISFLNFIPIQQLLEEFLSPLYW